ncbi:dipicolinate synthase subunit DpsA [Lutispora thermophila]|uniref:Dipicolinate synthase subunit A n=1 Tax=Lutispora thermophila DSM 19022 TaxID=1122184 RepID=A0A1M6I5H6_9FIRM|nr:dipicolinate synthase subunit DpsA [Lutispora thermophila]SHJ29726.1 dipicolinate synthase subunit A [Lutispora thermophila DSM 19022]
MSIGLKDRILILGGDERLVELAKLLTDKGFNVSTFGHESMDNESIMEYRTLEEGIYENNIIIGPVPFNTGQKINMKLSKKTASLNELCNYMKQDKKLYLGYPDKDFIEIAKEKDIKYYDYNSDESYQISNAAITAECAISIILKERSITISDSSILLIGYGRIGKILSSYLKAFNPDLYVAARKDTDLNWIRINGYKAIRIKGIDEIAKSIDVIINTVPRSVISNNTIEKIHRNSLIIDLASKPGGLDHDYAIKRGIKTIHALGLPGMVMPKSAAKVIMETIFTLQ